jgi:plastocyanin
MLKRIYLFLLVPAGAVALPLHAQVPSAPKPEITIAKSTFTPSRIVVKQGETIIWVNHDVVRHDATAANRIWKAGTILPGKSGTFTATKVGTFDYICTRHPSMKGTIVVEAPAPAPAPVLAPAPPD